MVERVARLLHTCPTPTILDAADRGCGYIEQRCDLDIAGSLTDQSLDHLHVRLLQNLARMIMGSLAQLVTALGHAIVRILLWRANGQMLRGNTFRVIARMDDEFEAAGEVEASHKVNHQTMGSLNAEVIHERLNADLAVARLIEWPLPFKATAVGGDCAAV